MRVLFVCSGNICRSPMAAEYLRHRAAHDGLAHLVVNSAGLLGIEGERAAPHAVTVLREAGIELAGHRSRGVRPSDVSTADLVVAMSQEHLEQLRERFPSGPGRRVLIREFERGPEPRPDAPDLDDPVGLPVAAFRDTFGLIRSCVDHLILHLKHAA